MYGQTQWNPKYPETKFRGYNKELWWNTKKGEANQKQEGHDGPVSLHWLIREIHSYQTLHYLGIGLKHKTPYKD